MTPGTRKLLLSAAELALFEGAAYLAGGVWGVIVVTGFLLALSPLLLMWGYTRIAPAVRDRRVLAAQAAIQAQLSAAPELPGGTGRIPDLARPAGCPTPLITPVKGGAAAPPRAA